jgi:hypothetical protein
VYMTTSSTRFLGLIAGLAAAWGGIVVFAGPSFSFEIDGATSAWVWNSYHATVWFVASVVGIAGALLMMFGWTRLYQAVGAVVAATGGVWFLIGPSLAQLWQTTAPGAAIGASNTTGMSALESIGYAYATGAFILLLAAFSLGLLIAAGTERMIVPTRRAREEEKAGQTHPNGHEHDGSKEWPEVERRTHERRRQPV